MYTIRLKEETYCVESLQDILGVLEDNRDYNLSEPLRYYYNKEIQQAKDSLEDNQREIELAQEQTFFLSNDIREAVREITELDLKPGVKKQKELATILRKLLNSEYIE